MQGSTAGSGQASAQPAGAVHRKPGGRVADWCCGNGGAAKQLSGHGYGHCLSGGRAVAAAAGGSGGVRANIGTTVTAQLLAFQVEGWRYLLLFGGVLLCLACKGWRGRCVGEAVFGFGLLFEGVTVMRSAMEPLLQSPLLRLELARVRQSPMHGLLAGVCMTLTVQSSSATVALLQAWRRSPGQTACTACWG